MEDRRLPDVSDEQMRERLAGTREYALVILHTTPRTFTDEGRPVVWEHGRRNMALQADGILSIVCPVTDGGAVAGICLFNCSVEEAREIIVDDPAVRAGVLEHEVHPVRGFPGDRLPVAQS